MTAVAHGQSFFLSISFLSNAILAHNLRLKSAIKMSRLAYSHYFINLLEEFRQKSTFFTRYLLAYSILHTLYGQSRRHN